MNGYKHIALGIALSHEERKEKIKRLIIEKDSVAGAIRSASDMDGMPHGKGGTSDPVAEQSIRMCDIDTVIAAEQERVNAVEWAIQYVNDRYSDDAAPHVIRAIFALLNGNNYEYDTEIIYLTENCRVSEHAVKISKAVFLKQITKYLYIGN